MGGFGSGRFGRRSDRHTDRDMVRVAIADLRRQGVFNPVAGLPISSVAGIELSGREEKQFVRLVLGAGETKSSTLGDRMLVRVRTRPQHLGGCRVWFECPRVYCRRRCSVLYRPMNLGSRAFACRRCYNVRYLSQSIAKGYRLERRAERVIDRIGGLEDGYLMRPARMHRKTFQRLAEQAETLMAASRNASPRF